MAEAAHAVAEIIPAALAAKPGRSLGDVAILYRDYRAGNVVAEAVAAAGLDFVRVDTAAPYRKVALTSWIEDCAAWCAGGWREARPQLRGLLDRWIGFHRARISEADASTELQSLTRLLWSLRIEEGLARDFVAALRAGLLDALMAAEPSLADQREQVDRMSTALAVGGPLADLDLASLGGRDGSTRVPAFLVHDSPREADLGLSIYDELFRLMRELEALTETTAFQYIVTTTTRPPDDLRCDPWLRLILRGAPGSARLMGRDL